jgi:hypothetical protein
VRCSKDYFLFCIDPAVAEYYPLRGPGDKTLIATEFMVIPRPHGTTRGDACTGGTVQVC